MYASSTVLLAPGTFSKDAIALLPPPLETITNLYFEACNSFIFSAKFINMDYQFKNRKYCIYEVSSMQLRRQI